MLSAASCCVSERARRDYNRCRGEDRSETPFLAEQTPKQEEGKLRLEGKEYAVKDGDVFHFRFNV